MQDRDRIRRSNRLLIIIALLFLLYGVFYRIQTGDNKLYIMGFEVELPFGGQTGSAETTGGKENADAAETAQDTAQDKADAAENADDAAQENADAAENAK